MELIDCSPRCTLYSGYLTQSSAGSAYPATDTTTHSKYILKSLRFRDQDFKAYRARQSHKCSSLQQGQRSLEPLSYFRQGLRRYEDAINVLGLKKIKDLQKSGITKSSVEQGEDRSITINLFGVLVTAMRSKDTIAVEKARKARLSSLERREQGSDDRENALKESEQQLSERTCAVASRELKASQQEQSTRDSERRLQLREKSQRDREIDLTARENNITYWERRQAPLRQVLANKERKMYLREQKLDARESELYGQEQEMAQEARETAEAELAEREQEVEDWENEIQDREEKVELRESEVLALMRKLDREKGAVWQEVARGWTDARARKGEEKVKVE